jgi:hypothetical protein
MKQLLATILLASLLGGCSKKSADAAPEPPAAGQTSKGPQAESVVAAGAADIEAKLQAQQYEAAVGQMATLKMMRMTEKDEEAYQRQLDRTLRALEDRARQGDQRAVEAQRMLGRMITGR